MPDTPTAGFTLSPQVDAWLLPFGEDQACGPDLEHDPEFLDLAQAAVGKPESQFAPAKPPDWRRVRELSESLFTRTRDLRVALWWARAKINLDGFSALPAVLALFHGLLERFWDHLHPMPDADDHDTARLSVIGGLEKLDSLLGDIRNSMLSSDRRLDGLRVRDVEVALEKLPPRTGEAPRTQGQIAGMLADLVDVAESLRLQTMAALSSLKQIQALMEQRFSPDMVVDLTTLRGILASVNAVLPAVAEVLAPVAVDDTTTTTGAAAATAAPLRLSSGVHSIDTRKDAIRAIELVCAYLERSEPTNPAQLLLRRAARVIDKNFLQLVRDLAPDAVKEVARIMGVDPGTINDQN